MRIRVRLFASYAQAAGRRSVDVDVSEGATLADVLAQLRRGPLLRLPGTGRPLFAVNQEHSQPTRVVQEGDEVAIFPPVSGGSGGAVEITAEPLDPARLADGVRGPSRGAVVTFEGTVRDREGAVRIEALDYECYAEMALGVLDAIRVEVESRHPGARLAMAHRTGRVEAGETSVVVACAAPHRRQAFAACRLAMDRIKESLPAWKREVVEGGGGGWR